MISSDRYHPILLGYKYITESMISYIKDIDIIVTPTNRSL